jgi:hypothetical protein
MRNLWSTLVGVVVVVAACRSTESARSVANETPAAALPEIRYYVIGDA